MGNKISYKCYLYQEDQASTKDLAVESKKLKIKRGASNSFAVLKKKLVVSFPVLKTAEYSIRYENDNHAMITILDDAMLEVALSQTSGPLHELHIHITAQGEGGVRSAAQLGEVCEPVAQGEI